MRVLKHRLLQAAAVVFTITPALCQVQIQFDYRFDSSGFFDVPNRRAALEAAANEYSSLLTDSLLPIHPSGSNTWNALVIRPDTGTMELLRDLEVPANTLTVFAGARTFSTDIIGLGEIGGLSLSGEPGWREAVRNRGQTGAPFTDFGPWGGSIGFDNSSLTTWHFDSDPLSLDDLPSGADDFFTVAVHELGHIFGFGTSASWQLQNEGGLFIGANASLTLGAPVPLDASGYHWKDGVLSRVFGSDVEQEPIMGPELLPGTRKFLTDLDVAGLRDIGWSVVPEPGSTVLLALGAALVWLMACAKSRRRPSAV